MKQMLTLYTQIESLAEVSSGLIDFKNKSEKITIKIVNDYSNRGLMILIKSIGNNIIFIAIFPTLLNLNPIMLEFEKVIDELSVHLVDSENQRFLRNMYKLV